MVLMSFSFISKRVEIFLNNNFLASVHNIKIKVLEVEFTLNFLAISKMIVSGVLLISLKVSLYKLNN